ncbi:histone acetylation protein-domain-containing protein [Pisolithus marmoratus]|nr:histone acetylation protein-domain-containing protein [Pisolithus marmoratus]
MHLRDALLASLANLPGSREFHLHVLVSSPRKHSNLTYLQDILILLSEQASPDARRLFVSAIEASVYHIPSTSSAIVYVSKVDSTGQAAAPSPTSTLVRAFLSYYANPSTRPLSVDHLWVHLFARAQSQYLFPNSAEFSGKRPLTDVKLCAWWKRQLTSVAEELPNAETLSTRLYYMLPSLGELEASHLLGHASCTSASSVTWVYGHPYSQVDVPLPGVSNRHTGSAPHIGQIIPWFDDDPKARFIDEIAYTTEADGVKSPERKRPRITDGLRVVEEEAQDKVVDKKNAHSQKEEQATKALRKVSVSEFWERMSFRQECIAGAITGFFVMAVSSGSPQAMARSEATPLAPQPGQVAPQLIKRVLTFLMTGHEFPTAERAAWSTKVLEESIRGLCDGLRTVSVANVGVHVAGSDRSTPEPSLTCATPQTPPPRLTYNAFVYGSLAVNNPGLPCKTPAESEDDGKPKVTVLAAELLSRGAHPALNGKAHYTAVNCVCRFGQVLWGV